MLAAAGEFVCASGSAGDQFASVLFPTNRPVPVTPDLSLIRKPSAVRRFLWQPLKTTKAIRTRVAHLAAVLRGGDVGQARRRCGRPPHSRSGPI